MARKKKIEVEVLSNDTQDLKRMVRNCRLFYKMGLVPSEEKLDPTPLAVPLGCETPLTRKEMFQMFGYGSYSNPYLYDDDDSEQDDWEGNHYSEFPISKDEVNEETGLTANEFEASQLQEENAIKDKLYQEHLEAQKSAVADSVAPKGDEGSPAVVDTPPVE